ncbi:MAG: response regulator [Gammaproteobacteria bacterium]|jgi:CheY-like chemotaxis protein|nr:response regulator [Gammaproteobacteria bacterium]
MTTLLYVEDDEDSIYMLSNRLQREGFDVLVARNGREGLDLAHDQRPDLIILDLVLPEMDGFETARRLRASQATAGIPIVALSASVLPEHRHRAIDAGCDDFEIKPVEFSRLLEKIGGLLSDAGRE